ncbi:hypothetical protein AVEN_14448-1 [Araneus ventricosus]|uniref:Uncharacterized protein n=1 Tax=Araneus ventricosus TaxID=182803 RepID=A0A4Y2SMU3_ARAVE|nr:hypothetical protein AVEN_14448-1 [Araneus ventricosus]
MQMDKNGLNFEEIISGSETSDCGNEKIPLFNISTEACNMSVKSPEIPLLHPIPIPKEMEDSVKQNKQLDFLHPETEEENSYADSHFDTDKRIKKLNSCIKNKFSIDSSALIDRNLIERIINDLNPDIPSRENFQSYQKSNSEKDLSTKVDNTETETFENENGESDMDNVHVVDRKRKSFAIDPESEKIAWEYSQQSLLQNTSFIDDTFDGSQPLFVSSQSQDVLDSAINITPNKKLTHNSEDFLHSNSQELFSTQVFIQDNKDGNIDIYSNEYVSIEHSNSKVLKNGICERTDGFNNDEHGEIIFLKESGNEISTDKNNLFTMNRKEDGNADSSKISPASDSILKADKVNGSNEETLESSHKSDIENYRNEFMRAASTSLEINLTNEQDMQHNYDYKDSLPIMDQEDESTKSLSDRCSNSPSLLVPNEKHQKKETENKNIENCNSKSECCSNAFDYVKNIRVVQGSFKKISITEIERENNTNNHEVSTVRTDYASKYATHCDTDSNSIIRLDHNNHNFIKLWLLKTDSTQHGKVANSPKRIFKSKSTRCSNRFQVPWGKVNAEEKNFNSERNKENLDAIEKSPQNNKQMNNRKLQQDFQSVNRMDEEKEIEEQINLTDIRILQTFRKF